MATVNEIKPNILLLEYRQENTDEDYGSCLYARFMFNLDRYELTIISDCGNYGYKWFETPKAESFLQLMSRCDKGYMLDKLYGSANIFDFEASKKNFLNYIHMEDDDENNDEDNDVKDLLDDWEFYGEPETAGSFCDQILNKTWVDNPWCFVEYYYPANALKIVSVFEEHIQPKIKEILKRS